MSATVLPIGAENTKVLRRETVWRDDLRRSGDVEVQARIRTDSVFWNFGRETRRKRSVVHEPPTAMARRSPSGLLHTIANYCNPAVCHLPIQANLYVSLTSSLYGATDEFADHPSFETYVPITSRKCYDQTCPESLIPSSTKLYCSPEVNSSC